MNLTGSADGRYKFTGKEQDPETSLYYFGARYYNAWSGRWLSVDPLANKYPGWSPYNYVEDNPTGSVDPNGAQVKPRPLPSQDLYGNLNLPRISLANHSASNPASISASGLGDQARMTIRVKGAMVVNQQKVDRIGNVVGFTGSAARAVKDVSSATDVAQEAGQIAHYADYAGYAVAGISVALTFHDQKLSLGAQIVESANDLIGALGMPGFVMSQVNNALIEQNTADYKYAQSHSTVGSEATSVSVPNP